MVTLIKYGTLSGGEKYNVNVLNLDGLSTDVKPSVTYIEYGSDGREIGRTGIPNGSLYTEIDTGDTYMYDVDATTWHKVSIGSGGGGGGGFTPTTTQLTAMNSGIDSIKVQQIATNENNISLKANTSDVNTATAGLQMQIDQIAQAAGTGSADTEVAQARVGADGTSYQTLKERLDFENTSLTGDLSRLTEDLTHLVTFNLFDKRVAKLGYFVQVNGNLTPNSNYFASDYIPVKAGTYRKKNFNNWYCCLYDNSKTFIQQLNDSDTVQISEDGYVVLSGLISDIDTAMFWEGSKEHNAYYPYVRSSFFNLTPMDFGAKGDGITVDNAALNQYFEYCRANSLNPNGYGRTYLVDDSTETFTDTDDGKVHKGVKAYGNTRISNFHFILKEGVSALTPCLTIMLDTSGKDTLVDNCTFSGSGGTEGNTGAEDGGNHGLLFVIDRMFPSSWQLCGNVTVRNCDFRNIWSYGIFLTPIDAIFKVYNCYFNCCAPAILTYATKSFVENCEYKWKYREGMIDTLCIDEIENFSDISNNKFKFVSITGCKSSREIMHISHNVQRDVKYSSILINNCYSDDKIFQTYDSSTQVESTIEIKRLSIKDSVCGTPNAAGRVMTLDHIKGDIILDNFNHNDAWWVISRCTGTILFNNTNKPTKVQVSDSDISTKECIYSEFSIQNEEQP